MKMLLVFLSAILMLGSMSVQAEAMFTLKGTAMDTRYSNQSGIRLSLLNWTEAEQVPSVLDAWRQYEMNGDAKAFAAFLEQQTTRGYLFSQAATGYSVKYAWQDESASDQRMIFLVTPGLKTRNPYLWNHPNEEAPEFSLVEIRANGEDLDMKTSLETGIELAAGDILQLQNFDGADLFARLQDATPYYLKQES